MKIVTNDYGCGTSSSIFDYDIQDVLIVSENNYEHVFDADDDLFFVGHDFLLYLWDTLEKVDRWKNFKHNKIVWAFERIDAIIPAWQQKSHYSISQIKSFADEIYACDEDDCDKYGYGWFPQWGSRKFYDLASQPTTNEKILFSGQAGKPEYKARNEMLQFLVNHPDYKEKIQITNLARNLPWEEYINNLLSHKVILNPVGLLRAFNTRAYEVMYSGRVLLQHTYGKYNRHAELLQGHENGIMFSTFEELQQANLDCQSRSKEFFEENNIYSRFEKIGVKIK